MIKGHNHNQVQLNATVLLYDILSILDQFYYYSPNAIHTTSISKHILYILSNKYTQFLSHQLVYAFALYRYGYSSATVFFLFVAVSAYLLALYCQ